MSTTLVSIASGDWTSFLAIEDAALDGLKVGDSIVFETVSSCARFHITNHVSQEVWTVTDMRPAVAVGAFTTAEVQR